MSAGLLLCFNHEAALHTALQQLRVQGVNSLRTYTPMAIEDEPGEAVAHGAGSATLPLVILIAGLGGTAAGFCMETYANTIGYRLDIGGRPPFSWPAFVPIAFEIGVLCAVLAGVLGYFAINRMPRLYEPIDELPMMQEAMRDGWLVAVYSREPAVLELTRAIGAQLDAAIQELPA